MGISKFKLLTMIIIYDMVLLIGTYDTFEAISRLISMKYHRDFLHNKISCLRCYKCPNLKMCHIVALFQLDYYLIIRLFFFLYVMIPSF